MKATAFLLAVLALLGVMVATDSASAGTINTNTTTLGSTSFGFSAGAADLAAFTRQTGPGAATTFCQTPSAGATGVATCTNVPQPTLGGGLTCLPAGPGLSCNGNTYVPIANSLPGALTSRPDKVVSTWTDFGCGDAVPTGATCVEGPPSTGINTLSRVIAVNGHNTAPGDNSCLGVVNGPGCALEGTLTGALHSEVALENLGTPEMPSGTIQFDWTPGAVAVPGAGPSAVPTSGTATFTQDINHVVTGLYTFNEHDTTVTPIYTYASRDFGNVAEAGETTGSNFGELYPGTDFINVRTTLTLTQNTLGGESPNTEDLGYTTRWGNTTGHPGGGVYFSPGLNIRDWTGNETFPPAAPAAPGDGLTVGGQTQHQGLGFAN